MGFTVRVLQVISFMKYQNDKALPWDIMKMRPFIDQRIEEVNNVKPHFQTMNSNMEFSAGDLSVLSLLGNVSLTPSATSQISTNTNNPPKPIARPTRHTPTQDTFRNTMGSTTFQPSITHENRSPYGFPYNQNQDSTTVTTSTTSGGGFSSTFHQPAPTPSITNGGNYGNHENSFPIDHFQVPGSSRGSVSSPMSVMSQPSSANQIATDTSGVFNFNNLSLGDPTSNVWQPTSVNGGQNYTAWSAGIDQPTTQPDPSQPDDIFSASSMFEMPPSAQSTSRPARIKRKQMNYFKKFGEYGNGEGDFTEPSGVSIDSMNRLVVADTNNNRIQVFDVFGNYLRTIDGQNMQFPNRIVVSKHSGRIVVTERAPTRRVQVFDAMGMFLTAFGEEYLQHPRGIALDDYDNVIVIECKVMRVNIFTITGKLLHRWGASEHLLFPNSVAVNSSQEIFISDNRDTGVKVFNYTGVFLRKIGGPGITDYPIAVAINNQGEVVVADNHNNFNITVFTQDGQLIEGFESKGRHAQCFDVALTMDGVAVVTSKDFKVFCYPYKMECPHIQPNPHEYIHPKEERSYRRN